MILRGPRCLTLKRDAETFLYIANTALLNPVCVYIIHWLRNNSDCNPKHTYTYPLADTENMIKMTVNFRRHSCPVLSDIVSRRTCDSMVWRKRYGAADGCDLASRSLGSPLLPSLHQQHTFKSIISHPKIVKPLTVSQTQTPIYTNTPNGIGSRGCGQPTLRTPRSPLCASLTVHIKLERARCACTCVHRKRKSRTLEYIESQLYRFAFSSNRKATPNSFLWHSAGWSPDIVSRVVRNKDAYVLGCPSARWSTPVRIAT